MWNSEWIPFSPLVGLNRVLVLIVGGLSYSSWCGWLNLVSVGNNTETTVGRLCFTGLILFVMFLLAMWYLRKSESLRKATEHLLSGEPEPESESESDSEDQERRQLEPKKSLTTRMSTHADLVGAAVLLQGFGNLTDAMGYILAQVWIEAIPVVGKPFWEAGIMCMSSVLILLVFEIMEKQLPLGSTRRAVLNILGQVGVGTFAWFVSTPAEALLYKMAGIPNEEDTVPPLWLWILSLVGAIAFMAVSNYLLTHMHCCHFTSDITQILLRKKNPHAEDVDPMTLAPSEQSLDAGAADEHDRSPTGHGSLGINGIQQEERTPLTSTDRDVTLASSPKAEDGELEHSESKPLPSAEDVAAVQQHLMADTIFCAKALAMLKATCFFTSARLLRTRILWRVSDRSHDWKAYGLGVVAYYAWASVMSALLEWLLSCLPKSEDKKTRLLASQFARESVDLIVRTIGWIAAKMTTNWFEMISFAESVTWTRVFWANYAVITQILAILVEEWRHRRLPKLQWKIRVIRWRREKAAQESSSEEESSSDEEE
eukprot:TRINITY_DN25244_c0_g1_i3.p1 TRINITY_DN25244_c0_g1~~TRINITY_DN25244_c0_g1_i3.p1  ORF type:complete len:542 (+),score=122.29 TRINITY_DN25244_c0_g1_i3:120-1745(+)